MRTRVRPRWLSRKVILAADALFGVVLVGIAFSGRISSTPPVPAPLRSRQTPPVEIVSRFGGLHPPGQSTGFAIAADGGMAVVDRGRQVVIRLNPNGRPQAEWGPNFAPGLEAQDLVGIAADGDGWDVLDRGALRILRLDHEGHAQTDRTIDLSNLETYGPNGLVADGRGNLFMADTGRNRIVRFNARSGAMTGPIGDTGSDLGKFKQPMFLAVGPDGSLFITDWENSRVQRLDPARRAANAWSVPVHAWGVAVDGLERVFVPDGDHKLVRVFGPGGVLLGQIGGDQGPAIPLDAEAQVGVSPDGAWLWLLGNEGLARVDLAPYAGLRPAGGVNAPLAVLGGILVLVAALGAGYPKAAGSRASSGVGASNGVGTGSNGLGASIRPGVANVVKPPRAGRGSSSHAWAGRVGRWLMALGGVAAVVAELALAEPAAKVDPWPRLAALGLASLVFAAGAVLSATAVPWRWVSDWPGWVESDGGRGRRDWRSLAVVVPVVVLAAVAAVTWWQGRFQTPEATRAALLWLAALVLSVGALSANARLKRPTSWALIPWALFVVALVPRAWNNADLPYGVWFDEAEAGLQARKFLHNFVYTPITDTYGRDASLFYYFISAAQAIIPDPVVAGRLVSAIAGALCAPLMYLLGRELFGWRVGLIAGVVVATLRWHLNVSRLGWDPISLPLCAILAFWLLARAIRTGRWRDAVWAGLGMGLGMHAYIAFRPLPLVGLVLLLYGGWRQRWRPLMFVGRVSAVLSATVLATLPVIIFAIQDPTGFNGRVNQTLILNEPVPQTQKLDEIWSNLQKHLLMFHVSGDMNGRHNLPGVPMLDPLSGLLLMVGLALLVVRPFDWRSWLVFGWTIVSMAGGILTFPFEAPQAMRTLGLTPVLALLVAVALVVVLDRAASTIRRPTRVHAAAASAVACVAIAWIGTTSLSTFFSRQMNDPTVWESFSTRETLPSRAALAASQPYEAILGSPIIAPSLQQQLMVPTVQNTIRAFDASTDLPYRGNGPGLIVLEDEHEAGLADEVARYYPDAPRRSIVPPNGVRPTADEIELDASLIRAHRGLAAANRGDGTWRADLAVDVPGAYAFRTPSGVTLTLDGTEVTEGASLELARGNHLITLRGTAGSLAWLTPGATAWQTVDDRLLFAAPDGGNGLQATFYPTRDFEGSPTETIIDPIVAHYYHVSPFARLNMSPPIWSAEWGGMIDVPSNGTYRFEVERLSRAGLWLDEKAVFDDTGADGPTQAESGAVQLTAGRHRMRVRLQQRGEGGPRLYLYWTPPGGARELVPGRVLYPPPPTSVQ